MQKEDKKTKIPASDREVSGFHIEGDKFGGKMSFCISFVVNVMDFNEEAVLLKLRRGKIRLTGRELSISVYENNIVEIFGKVRCIELL